MIHLGKQTSQIFHFIDQSTGANNSIIQTIVAEYEKKMAGVGRVLLRPSGTEPVVRVMVEGQDERLVIQYTEEIADVVAKELN